MEEDDPMLRLREHCKKDANRNRGQKPQALLLRATMHALCKAIRGLPSKKVIRDDTGISFFRRYYFREFPDIIRVNTQNTAPKALGAKKKKKKKTAKRKG